jgi:cystathionine beta-synthase
MAERGAGEVDGRPARVLVFLADAGHKYVSKIFNDDWMRENGFLEDSPGLGTVRDVLAGRGARPLVTARSSATLREVITQMKATEISQVPVVDGGKLRGIVAEVDLLRALVTGGKTFESPIGEVIEDDYATVTPNTKIELLKGVLADAKVAIVEDAGEVLGIVTKIDLIDYLARSAQTPSVPPAAVP